MKVKSPLAAEAMLLSKSPQAAEKPQTYQSWDLACLAPPLPSQANQIIDPVEPSPAVAETPEIDLEQLIQTATTEARDKGYQAGYAEGLEQGLAKAIAEHRECFENQSRQLDQLLMQFALDLKDARTSIAEDLLGLSLSMCQAILKTSLTIQPELLVNLITETLQSMPHLQLPARIYLNPVDLSLIQTSLGESLQAEGWELHADENQRCGGCKIITASQEIDASLSSRWQQLIQALGQDPSWLIKL